MVDEAPLEGVLRSAHADLVAAVCAGEGVAEVKERVRGRLRAASGAPGPALRDLVVANRALRDAMQAAAARLDAFEAHGCADAPIDEVLDYARYIGDSTSAPPGYAPPNPLYNGLFAFPSSDMMLSSALRLRLGAQEAGAPQPDDPPKAAEAAAEAPGEAPPAAKVEEEDEDEEEAPPDAPTLLRQESELGRKRQRERNAAAAAARKKGKLSLGFSESEDSSSDESD